MNTFGKIKCKIVSKLSDSYTKQDKKYMKNTLSLIKENKDFVESYLLYESIENKYFSDSETAKFYVEELSKSLNGKSKSLRKFLEKINETIGDVETDYPSVYDNLDSLMEEDSLLTIENKVKAKIDLVNYLTSKKEVVEESSKPHSKNENLLYAVLANNFNVLYDSTLNESEKNELKSVLSLSNEDLEKSVKDLKESVNDKISKLLSESSEDELTNKLNKVKSEVGEMNISRVNYIRLKQLKSDLD
jgi:regulator of replication initiation timing